MNIEETSIKIAEVHYEAVLRRKAEFIEEVMDHVHCHEEDKETLRKLVARSFQEGVDAFVKTQLQIMEVLEEEGASYGDE